MKALIIVLLLVLCFKGNLSKFSDSEAEKYVLCYECSQSGSYHCENTKLCNSTSGLCQLIIYEGKDGEKSIRKSCALDCGFPTSLFIDAKSYHALCCAFSYCNQLQYSRELTHGKSNVAVSVFTASLFWALFSVILQSIGLED